MSGDGSDFVSKAREQYENAQGTLLNRDVPLDLTEVFHPKIDGSTPVAKTGLLLHGKDLADVFEPLASGDKIDLNTGFRTKLNRSVSTDLRDIFCKKDSVPVAGTLTGIPRGSFDCDTTLYIWLDTSGSMSDALGYIRRARGVILQYFRTVYSGPDPVIRETSDERCIDWIGSGSAATNYKEASIAFINESDSGGPGTANNYITRWNTCQRNGGVKYGAIGGVVGGGYAYANQIRGYLDGAPPNNLRDYGVQDFWDIDFNTTAADYVQMIISWLNIPTEPSQLKPTVRARNEESRTQVKWDLDDYICGRTGVPDASGTGAAPGHSGYTLTQSKWKVDVAADSNGDVILQSTEHTKRPTSVTYIPTMPGPLDYYCRLTAVGMSGYADKSSAFVKCSLQDTPPVLTMLGDSEIIVE